MSNGIRSHPAQLKLLFLWTNNDDLKVYYKIFRYDKTACLQDHNHLILYAHKLSYYHACTHYFIISRFKAMDAFKNRVHFTIILNVAS